MYEPPNNLSLWFRFQFLSAFPKTSKGVLVDIALCAAIWAMGRSALKGGYSSVVSPSKNRRKMIYTVNVKNPNFAEGEPSQKGAILAFTNLPQYIVQLTSKKHGEIRRSYLFF